MLFSNLMYKLQNFFTDEKVLFVSGYPGSGKTFSALRFCDEHKESLYFSFKNLEANFALRVFCNTHTKLFSGCKNWTGFFNCLNAYGNKKHPLVFFDNAGERNDKDDFYKEYNKVAHPRFMPSFV